jgi:hypothetical protein
MLFLPTFYTRLATEGINGLHAIQFIFFCTMTILEDTKKQTNTTSNDVDPDINTFIKKIKNKYLEHNISLDFDLSFIITKLYDLINLIDIREINKISLLNDMFEYYINKENLAVIKDYVKFYNKKILSDWIIDISRPKISEQMETIFAGNIKINSYLDIIVKQVKDKNINFDIVSNKLYGNQPNLIINSLAVSNLLLNSQKNFNQNINSNDLLINDIGLPVQSFDLILFDFPTGIHNMIHANCCQKIKKLKLRGTKSEPLLLQLIMCSLNKNGRAVLVVPDSLLFSDSIQPIETRKYLVENFNIKKVIQIDESLYVGKGNKNSILYFENNGSTKSVQFSKISLDSTEKNIEETKQTDISIERIKENIYSLYFKNYESIKNVKNEVQTVSFNELFEFKNNNDSLPDGYFLCLEKYYKNINSVMVGNKKQEKFEHYIVSKKLDMYNFNVKLLENIVRTKHLNLVKGKMNQFDISKITQIEIPIISDLIKKSICDYLEITNQVISDNNNKILNTQKLKSCLLNSICSDKLIPIENIVKLHDKKSELDNTKMIGVIRNGMTAGQVYILDKVENISTNSHYLKLSDINYLIDFIYQYLKHNETKLKDLSNLNPQPNLSQTNLLNFKIPILSMENQIELITHCNDFDSIINKYEANNRVLIEKDIMGTILKINMIF